MVTQRLMFPELGEAALAEGWLAEEPPATAEQVLEALAWRHPMAGMHGEPANWVFAREVCAEAGQGGYQQRFDAVAIGLVPGNGLMGKMASVPYGKWARVVYEVKVSRADWLREQQPIAERPTYGGGPHRLSAKLTRAIARGEVPEAEILGVIDRLTWRHKWDAALAVSTQFWYAAPPRCILPDELPPEAGLLEVRLKGSLREPRARVIVPAPVRETALPPQAFWAAVLRRAAGEKALAVDEP